MNDTDRHGQEEYEKRLQYRLGLFFESLAAGKIHFNKGLRVIESIQRVVRNPDGTFDLSTVDASVRSAALAIEHFRYRDDTKKAISLKDIQNTYFTFIWNQFEQLYSAMKSQNLTPHHVAEFYASDHERVEKFLPAVEEIIDTLKSFWTDVFDANEYHLEDIIGTTKGVFGGDLFPSNTESIASKCGIYIDTTILPDPFLRMSRALQFYEPNRRVYYVIKHALNVLKYMDLACSDLPIPILAIYPDKPILEEDEQKYIHTLG